jgi:hypothetical protein
MRVHLLKYLLVCLILVLCFHSSAYADDVDFMSISEIEDLLEDNEFVPAIFYSVPRGAELKLYAIQIQGVLRTPGIEVIMFTTSSQIEAGMSGSPVYVDDKLIGALAYKLSGSETSYVSWGGISPIHLMKREANAITDGTRLDAINGFHFQGMSFEPIELLELVSISGQDSEDSRMELEYGFELKAGMPIVVDLASWTDETGREKSMSALGTVTYVGDDKRVYAFGHPFLNNKNVRYAFRTAEILGTISGSNKISGKVSDVIGIIDTDSGYGIYGDQSLNDIGDLHDFSLEFKINGTPFHDFDIRLSDSVQAPVIAASVFNIIGQANGAPHDHEISVTEIDVQIDITGQQSVNWGTLYHSQIVNLGINTFYQSSYTVAVNALIAGVYRPLFVSNYKFDIEQVHVVTNFVSAQAPVLKLSSYDFPKKVVWGENPSLMLRLVANDNSIATSVSLNIAIDWDTVEKPIYGIDTKDSDKENNKRIYGTLYIYGASRYQNVLRMTGELQAHNPNYFFGPEDFLKNFSEKLKITNRYIYGKVTMKAKETSSKEVSQEDGDEVLIGIQNKALNNWEIIEGGLEKRDEIKNRSGNAIFNINFPDVPSGYIVQSDLGISHTFELGLGEKDLSEVGDEESDVVEDANNEPKDN